MCGETFFGELLHDVEDHHARESVAALVEKDNPLLSGLGLPADCEVFLQGVDRRAAHGHEALLRAFAFDEQEAVVEADVL